MGDHFIHRLHVLILLESRSHLHAVRLAALPAIFLIRRDPGDPAPKLLCHLPAVSSPAVGDQVQPACFMVLHQKYIVKAQDAFRDLHGFLLPALHSLFPSPVIIGEIADSAGDDGQICGILLPVRSQIFLYIILQTLTALLTVYGKPLSFHKRQIWVQADDGILSQLIFKGRIQKYRHLFPGIAVKDTMDRRILVQRYDGSHTSPLHFLQIQVKFSRSSGPYSVNTASG